MCRTTTTVVSCAFAAAAERAKAARAAKRRMSIIAEWRGTVVDDSLLRELHYIRCTASGVPGGRHPAASPLAADSLVKFLTLASCPPAPALAPSAVRSAVLSAGLSAVLSSAEDHAAVPPAGRRADSGAVAARVAGRDVRQSPSAASRTATWPEESGCGSRAVAPLA